MMIVEDLALIDRANEALANNQLHAALADLDQALRYVETPHARWNRSQVLLALGDYPNGCAGAGMRDGSCFRICSTAKGERPQRCAPLWRGENIAGKRLLIYHEAGYGDSIMLLRFVPQLQSMGAEVTLLMPSPLWRLAAQFASGDQSANCAAAYDYRCPMLVYSSGATGRQPRACRRRPICASIRNGVKPIDDDGRKRIGMCWSSESTFSPERSDRPSEDSSPRWRGNISSTACRTTSRNAAARYGVQTFRFRDFAEVAALIMRMDAIVSIDSAALNLAGAIGHPQVNALLPFSPVWRWHNARWYPRIRQCRQERRGDWTSALMKLPNW